MFRDLGLCAAACLGSSAAASPAWLDAEGLRYEARDGVVAVLGGPAGGDPIGSTGWKLVQASGEPGAAMAEMVALGAAYAAPVFTGLDGGPVIPTAEILVVLDQRGPASGEAIEREAAGLGLAAEITAPWPGLDLYRVRTDASRGDRVLALCRRLSSLDGVALAEPDMLFTGRSSFTPDDPFFPELWGIRNVGQAGGEPDADMDGDEAWDITTGDASVLTVVIDTGVDQHHPDLHQAAGEDFFDWNGDGGPRNACDNHGTPVAGCIAAMIDNGLGTVGIAPGTRIASARVFESDLSCDGTWTTFTSSTVSALQWAMAIGARVTNNSNFYGFSAGAIREAYEQTRDAGMVHFASAGNSGNNGVTYPASLDRVLAVGAIDRFGSRASFSNFGDEIFLTAPGVSIVTTDRPGGPGWSGGDYTWATGTSFASPYAAGVAALVLSVDPSLSAPEVEALLAQTADDYGGNGRDNQFGWGVVNARAALEAAGGAGCPWDLAPPSGVLDLADVNRFVALFLAQDPAIDLAPPAGVIDLADIIAFTQGFLAGCP